MSTLNVVSFCICHLLWKDVYVSSNRKLEKLIRVLWPIRVVTHSGQGQNIYQSGLYSKYKIDFISIQKALLSVWTNYTSWPSLYFFYFILNVNELLLYLKKSQGVVVVSVGIKCDNIFNLFCINSETFLTLLLGKHCRLTQTYKIY